MTRRDTRPSPIRRLAVPCAVFTLFSVLWFLGDAFLPTLSGTDSDAIRRATRYMLAIGFWLSSATMVNRLIRVLFWDRIVARALHGPAPRLLIDLTTLLVYIIAATVIIGVVFKAPLTGLWTTSGVLGLVLGFALRNTIADLFTGIAVNVDRPYRIGDWIQVHERTPDQNVIGEVVEMGWRTTRIRTEANNVVVIPNSIVGLATVTNFDMPAEPCRFEASFTLDFSVPEDRARRVLLAAAASVLDSDGFVRSPQPQVLVGETSDLGVTYVVRYWITPWKGTSPSRARDTVSSAVLEHLSSAGLSLAYPKEDIYFDQMPTRHLDSASTADRTQLLQRVDLLEPMTDAELEELASSMRRHTFTKDEVVLREGDQGSSMFLVVEGLLSVHSDHPIDGATRVGQAAPGEVIGEMSLLTGEPRSATALAVTEVIAYEITKEHFQQLLARRPEIADSISQIVARRRESTEGLLHAADADQLPAQPASLASQLLTRIRTFLGGGQLTGEAHSANAPHRFPEQ